MAFDDDQVMHAEVGLSLPLEKFEAELDRAFGDFKSRVAEIDRTTAQAEIKLDTRPFEISEKEVKLKIEKLKEERLELEVDLGKLSKEDRLRILSEMKAFQLELKAITREKLEFQVDLANKQHLLDLEKALAKEERDRSLAQRKLEDSREASVKRRISLERGARKEETDAYKLNEQMDRDKLRNIERIYEARRRNGSAQVLSEEGASRRFKEYLQNEERRLTLERNYKTLLDSTLDKQRKGGSVDLDTSRAEVKLALLREQIDRMGGTVHINIEGNTSFLTKFEKLKEKGFLGSIGSAISGGAAKAGGFGSRVGKADVVPGFIDVSLATALKALPLLLPAAGGLGSLASTTGFGLAGAGAIGGGLGAGLVGNFLGLAGALVKTKQEFEAVATAEKKYEEQVRKTGSGSLLAQKALNEFHEVLKQVGPTAAKSEQELQGLLKLWTKFTQPARNAVVDIVGEVGRRGRALVPGLARNTNETAGILRQHTSTFLDHATDPGEIKRLDQLGKSANIFLDHALTGAENLAAVLFHVGESAARLFGGPLGEGFQHWAEGLNKANQPGKELDATVKHLGEDAKDVWGFLEALTKVLGDLFSGSREAGENLFQSMTRGLDKWDHELKSVEGKKGMKKFFNESSEVLKELFPIFKEFAKLLAEWSVGLIPITKGILKMGADLTKVVMKIGELVGFNQPFVAFGEVIAAVFAYKKFAGAVEATKLIYNNIRSAGSIAEGFKTIFSGGLFKKQGPSSAIVEGAQVGSKLWYDSIVAAAEQGAIVLRGGVASGGKVAGAEIAAEERLGTGGIILPPGVSRGTTAVEKAASPASKVAGGLGVVGTGVVTVAGLAALFGTHGAEDGHNRFGLPTGSESFGGKFDRYGAKEVSNLAHLQIGKFVGGIFGSGNDESGSEEKLRKFDNNLEAMKGHLQTLPAGKLKQLQNEARGLANDPALKRFHNQLENVAEFLGDRGITGELKKVGPQFDRMKRAAGSSLESITATLSSTNTAIRQTLPAGSRAAGIALARNFENAANDVQESMNKGVVSTKQGIAKIAKLMTAAFESLGINPKAAKKLAASGESVGESEATIKSSENAGLGGPNESSVGGKSYQYARGGLRQYGRSGETGQDSIRTNMVVAPGEVGAVFTKDQQDVANTLLAPVGGLPGLFSSFAKPHYMASGGIVSGLGGVHAGAARVASALINQFPGLSVTSTTGGGHAHGSYHYLGEAVDVGGGTKLMDTAAAWLGRTWGRALAEGIHNPDLSIKDGHSVSPSFWGAETWAEHLNHIHLAVLGGKPIPGGVSSTLGEGGAAGHPAFKPFKAPRTGGKGLVHALTQGVVDKVTHNVNAYISRVSGGGGGGAGEITNVGNLKSLNHIFKEGVALSPKLVERIATWAGLPGHLFAQIAHGESSYMPGEIEPTESIGIGGVPVKGYGLWQLTTGVGNDSLINRFGGTRAMLNPLKNALAAKALYDAQGAGAWHGTKYVTGYSKGGYFGSPALLVGEHNNEYVINPSREDNASYLHQAATEMGYRVTPAKNGKAPVKNVLSTPADKSQLPILSEAANNHGVPAEALSPVVKDIEAALKTEKTTYAKLTVQEKKAIQKLAKNKSAAAHSLAQAYARSRIGTDNARHSGSNSVASAKRSVQSNPNDPAAHLRLAEAERKAGEGVRRAETTSSLGIQNAKFHGDASVSTAIKSLEDIRKGKSALVRGGKWHDEKFIAIGKLEHEKNEGHDAQEKLKRYEKHIASLNRSLKSLTHGMNIDSSRYNHSKDPNMRAGLKKDWESKLGGRKKIVEELETDVTASKNSAKKFIHDHKNSPHVGQVSAYLESVEDQLEEIQDKGGEIEAAEEGGVSGQGSTLTPEAYLEALSPGGDLSSQLKGYEESYALAQAKVTPDNPNTPPNEELPGLQGERQPAEYIQSFWENVLKTAQGSNQPPELITQLANNVASARSTAFGLVSSIEGAEKGVSSQNFQESQAFSVARLDLYRNFGSNFAPIWAQPAPSLIGPSGSAGIGGGPGKTVNVSVTNHFSHPPNEPHTWSNGLSWELQAAI